VREKADDVLQPPEEIGHIYQVCIPATPLGHRGLEARYVHDSISLGLCFFQPALATFTFSPTLGARV
jgi:hypothetical protein